MPRRSHYPCKVTPWRARLLPWGLAAGSLMNNVDLHDDEDVEKATKLFAEGVKTALKLTAMQRAHEKAKGPWQR